MEVQSHGDLQSTMKVEESEANNMDVSLMQSRVKKKREQVKARTNTSVVLEKESTAFNCTSHPKFCEAPFECHKMKDPFKMMQTGTRRQAKNLPNLQSWCGQPQYESYIHECLVKKNLVKAGQIQYDLTKAGKFGPTTYEHDGSYCFIEGHCLNTRVTKWTTLEEANQMCDERYGHSRWANFGSLASPDTRKLLLRQLSTKNESDGFKSQEDTTPFLVAACAMGNYHCDVMYCKETYCKDKYMVKKYGHFLKDLKWMGSTASWMNQQSKYGHFLKDFKWMDG